MSRCIESIKLLDGKLPLLAWHERRFQATSSELFGTKRRRSLAYHLSKVDLPQKGLYKIRVVYAANDLEISYAKYETASHSKIELIFDDGIDYHLKYENRDRLNGHRSRIKGDDILIVKQGFITDAWYSNVILCRNEDWFTPKTYLLNGVKRQQLIASGLVKEIPISIVDLGDFKKIAFVNAMRDFEKIYTFELKDHFLHLKELT